MTLLFYTSSEEVIIATDTPVCEQDGSTVGHCPKAVAPLHMRFVIAATGATTLFNRWFGLVNKQRIAVDMDTLDLHTSLNLQTLWREMQREITACLIAQTIPFWVRQIVWKRCRATAPASRR